MVIFCKAIGYHFKRLKHPRAVIAFRVDNSVIDQGIVATSTLYLSVYLVVVFLSSIGLAFLGVDPMSAFSASVATMGNVGPGFSMVSSFGNYSQLPVMGKWILSIVMLLGRLEIYGFLMLLVFRFIR